MPSEGRVEIFANGYWGTVCDDGWDQADARVVCRQLGFSDSLEATTESRFGRGTGEILLDDVACTASDDELVKCSHSGIGMHNCNHGEDAGVVCDGVAGMLFNLTPCGQRNVLTFFKYGSLESIYMKNKKSLCKFQINTGTKIYNVSFSAKLFIYFIFFYGNKISNIFKQQTKNNKETHF